MRINFFYKNKCTGVEIEDDGTFNKTGTYTVPSENIPATLAAYASFFENIPYTLTGKVNNDKLFAVVVLTVSAMGTDHTVNVVAGDDDFEAKAPTGEAYPTPNGTAIIYLNGRQHCDGTPYEGGTFSNVDLGIIKDEHIFDGFYCTVCGEFNKEYLTPNADGYYEISTALELIWFATYVNQVNTAANGLLTADITLTDAWTLPLGSNTKPYTGTFDGQGHKISGFEATSTGYFGIIGYANGATVKDFSLDGTMEVTSGTGSGIVGYTLNGTISGLHSTLNIPVPSADAHHTAGVVGSSQSGNTISQCSFSGTLTVTGNTRDCFGGVCGYIKADNVTDCASYGNISYTRADGYVGGVVGYLNNASGIIKNCLATGTVTYAGEGDPTYGGTLIGRLAAHTAAYITNNYWLENTSHAGIGQNTPENNNEVTAEQLASGEVAYKLGSAWSQLLDTDNVPAPYGDYQVSYVGDAGYATFFDATTGYELNGNVAAFVATAFGTYLVLTEVPSIPAGTPVILEGAYFNKIAADLPDMDVANDLKGTATDTEADGTMYVLAQVDDVIGFYKATGTIPAGKAYYQSTSGVKGFLFADDVTAISSPFKGEEGKESSIYNLAGQRLSKKQKGINITYGKKVLY